MHRRWWVGVLGLATASAFALSPELRQSAIAQLRAIAEPLLERGPATDPHFDAFYVGMVEALPPQAKAERALELALNRRLGAAEYVLQQAQSWRGQIQASERLQVLVNTAVESPLIEVRLAAFELHLAAHGLRKSGAQVERLVQRLQTDQAGSGPWALWNLGVLGARGVERERVHGVLLAALRAEDETLRRWAVDGLAKFGGVEIIGPLLDIAAREPSALVRERAYCALAQSGTLQLAERYEAVPGLLAIAADPQAGQQSVAWAYQALREITSMYDLPDQAAPWRERLGRTGLL